MAQTGTKKEVAETQLFKEGGLVEGY